MVIPWCFKVFAKWFVVYLICTDCTFQILFLIDPIINVTENYKNSGWTEIPDTVLPPEPNGLIK